MNSTNSYNKALIAFQKWAKLNPKSEDNKEIYEYCYASLHHMKNGNFRLGHHLAMTAAALDAHFNGKPSDLSMFCLHTLHAATNAKKWRSRRDTNSHLSP